MSHKIDAMLLVSLRRTKLHATALQALHDYPGQAGRPRCTNNESEQLDQQQCDASAKKDAATISQTSTCTRAVK